ATPSSSRLGDDRLAYGISQGHAGTAQVGSYPPNGYGLNDMIGNVWESTSDQYQAHSALVKSRPDTGSR
ncbi:MAG TPA: SUMF1/EgtB/PvdO family nonheme iron enzyme, partial [Propionibacteriaceae bacterium]|nr:SUMF1/EgtB/PvdO family nonheme iron enzyme [Propionibacteriaceae bacterium]